MMTHSGGPSTVLSILFRLVEIAGGQGPPISRVPLESSPHFTPLVTALHMMFTHFNSRASFDLLRSDSATMAARWVYNKEVWRKEKDEGFHFIWEMDVSAWHFHHYCIQWWKILAALGQNARCNWVGSGVAEPHRLIGFLCSVLFLSFLYLLQFIWFLFFFFSSGQMAYTISSFSLR